MKYTAHTHFSAMAEVEDFCRYVVIERGIFFHPEDKFNAEIDNISEEEASVWNRLLEEMWCCWRCQRHRHLRHHHPAYFVCWKCEIGVIL